ncbi:MAG TPA: hypothetical protein VHE60_07660 [Pyrinomonadaceae bacterium]|nr:hypothetical protein [Pyrinomonadaceae bacterium]
MPTSNVAMPPNDSQLLGPFIGNVNAFAATIWLQIPNLVKDEARSVFVTLHEGAVRTIKKERRIHVR